METEILERIKRLRKKSGLTAAEVAERMGFSGQGSYTKVELGKVELKLSHISRLAEIFEVSIASLLGLEDGANADQGQVKALEGRLKELEFDLYKAVDLLKSLQISMRIGKKFLSFVEKRLAEKDPSANAWELYKRIVQTPAKPEHREYFMDFFKDDDVVFSFRAGLVKHKEWNEVWAICQRNEGWENAPALPMFIDMEINPLLL